MERTRTRRIFTSVALVLFGVGLALLIAEIAARAAWRETVDRVYHPPAEDLPAVVGVFGLMRPNASGIYRGVYYRSNSAGFRGREYAADPPPGIFRIAVFGDSFTMGDGVLEEQAYPHLVERKLNRRPGQRFEVLNWGLSGANIRQAIGRMRPLAARFKPHLIVYGFTVNDIEGDAYLRSASVETQVKERMHYLQYSHSGSYLLRFAWPRMMSLRDLLQPPQGTYMRELLHNYLNNPEAWHDFETGLDELVEVAEELDTPIVVFMHTTLAYLNRLHPLRFAYSQVRDAAGQRGLHTIESFPSHLGYRSENLWVNELDPHPNDLGHEILAQALIEGLADLPDDRIPLR